MRLFSHRQQFFNYKYNQNNFRYFNVGKSGVSQTQFSRFIQTRIRQSRFVEKYDRNINRKDVRTACARSSQLTTPGQGPCRSLTRYLGL